MEVSTVVIGNLSQKQTTRWEQNRTFAIKPTQQQFVQLSDTQILAAIGQGDERIFEQVFRKYYAGLCTYGRGILRDAEEAEEIVQNVFVTIWEKREILEITQSLQSYLYRAVHNHCLNRIKQQKVCDEQQKYAQH